MGQKIKLFSNYFSLEFDSPTIQGVNKYTCKFEPEVPDNTRKVRGAILAKEKVKEHLNFYIDWGNCVYSLKKAANVPVFKTEHDGTKYKIARIWHGLFG